MTILWVDDEPGNMWTAVARLQERGDTVQIARSAEEAIGCLWSGTWTVDVVVLDLWLMRRELHDDEDPKEDPVARPVLVDPEAELPPCLRIADGVLPEDVGVECARIVRQELGLHVPIVIYSCRVEAMAEWARERCAKMGVHRLLPKAPTDEQLIDAIDEAAQTKTEPE